MARFTPQILDDIRNRLTLSDIVGRRVTYDKRKSQPQKGDFWACCPFHNEKTPSFHVDDRRGIYHCFGCGVTGDHFRFLTEKEGLPFPEAVERLADEAGVSLPKLDPRQVEQEKQRASLYDVMALAQQFFVTQLQSGEAAAARGYLQRRGLTLETQKKFGIGFAPRNRNALKQFLADKGIEHQQMVDAGLVVSGPDIPVSYDKFRDRIMFPILDLRERVIAFGGRAMSADNPAKYMNSPETSLFSKRTVLYNAANARRVAYDRKRLIVVEGYMDVIALAQVGIEEAVAPLGTALTADQMHLLWKMTDEPILCFDGDEAGLRAAQRSIDVTLPLLKPGKTAQFSILPEGQDPDDLIQEEGVDAVEAVLSSARSLSDMLWARETEAGNFDTPERKAALEARLGEIVKAIGDLNVRRYYEEAFRERLRALFSSSQDNRQSSYASQPRGRFSQNNSSFRNKGTRFNQAGPPAISEKLRRNPLTSRNYERDSGRMRLVPRELVLVATLINHPRLLDQHLETFAAIDFRNGVLKRVQTALIDVSAEENELNPGNLRQKLQQIGLQEEIEQIEITVRNLRLWQIGADAPENIAEIGWKQALTLHHRAHTLNKELKAAERAWADDASEINLERLQDVNAQIASLDGTEALIDELEAVFG